jgi:hypothetical protein
LRKNLSGVMDGIAAVSLSGNVVVNSCAPSPPLSPGKSSSLMMSDVVVSEQHNLDDILSTEEVCE